MGRQRFEVDLRLDVGLDALRERHGRVVRPQELRTEGEGHAYPVHAWCEGERRHLHTLLVYLRGGRPLVLLLKTASICSVLENV